MPRLVTIDVRLAFTEGSFFEGIGVDFDFDPPDAPGGNVSVPDGGTVLLGGIINVVPGNVEDAVAPRLGGIP